MPPAPANSTAAAQAPAPAADPRPPPAKGQGRGPQFAMLTAYDTVMAGIFDESGIEVLLVGDSAANTVVGYSSTLPITLDEMVVFAKAVTSGVKRALVVCDLPFGSYEVSPEQAVDLGRPPDEGGRGACREDGGRHLLCRRTCGPWLPRGIPVMAHIGFTPQSRSTRWAATGSRAAARPRARCRRRPGAEAAGAFAVLMEMVPTDTARRRRRGLHVPTVGHRRRAASPPARSWSGRTCSGWAAARAHASSSNTPTCAPSFREAARAYHEDVVSGTFPAPSTVQELGTGPRPRPSSSASHARCARAPWSMACSASAREL